MGKTKTLAPYSTLDSISNETHNNCPQKIVVRIIHIWEVRDFRRNNILLSLECLLLDENGSAIQASVLPNCLPKFKDQLVKGQLYIINEFDVLPSSIRYRRTNHKCRIVFSDKTSLDKGEELPDVVGQVFSSRTSEKKDQNNPSKTTFNLILTCILESGDNVYISLWGELAVDAHAKLLTIKDETVVVIATHVNPRKVGRYVYLNGTSSSQILLNYDNTVCQNFCQSNQFKESIVPPIIDGSSHFDPNALYMIEDVESYVKEQGGKEKSFWCKVKVVDIVLRNGWNYISCSGCNLKMDTTGSTISCLTCPPTQAVGKLQYRIQIIVDDGQNTTNFVILNQEATKLLKRTASDLANDKLNCDGPAKDVPDAIKALLGKVFYFNVKVSDYNFKATYQTFTVTSIKEEQGDSPLDPPTTGELANLECQGEPSSTSGRKATKKRQSNRSIKANDEFAITTGGKQKTKRKNNQETVPVGIIKLRSNLNKELMVPSGSEDESIKEESVRKNSPYVSKTHAIADGNNLRSTTEAEPSTKRRRSSRKSVSDPIELEVDSAPNEVEEEESHLPLDETHENPAGCNPEITTEVQLTTTSVRPVRDRRPNRKYADGLTKDQTLGRTCNQETGSKVQGTTKVKRGKSLIVLSDVEDVTTLNNEEGKEEAIEDNALPSQTETAGEVPESPRKPLRKHQPTRRQEAEAEDGLLSEIPKKDKTPRKAPDTLSQKVSRTRHVSGRKKQIILSDSDSGYDCMVRGRHLFVGTAEGF
ncbi:PREDICTED: uncharacterized protein LOC104753067 [Camelina sativa]|uniref:Uncharacterized protein LOC104753067 n=1 Tax=Camelina sativa TaxID=90675 RepID=A0ABM0WNG9_CAMSA|nr:PREDICTED: uncharacterized protein LOC104753067 [Camelina sativa]